MASLKRENPSADEQNPQQSKRANNKLLDRPFQFQFHPRVVLNPADSNLDFIIEADGLTGHALYEEGFAYCWSGARTNIGITRGKYCFGCRIVSGQPVKMEDTPLDQQNVCRVGISRGDDPVGNLGETEHSYGFGGTGKFSNAGRFVEYGERFGIGDTIVCLVDLESKPWASIEFSKNGKRLGIAKHFDAGPNGLRVVDSPVIERPWESALFPHVLLKNVVVVMQFSIEDGLVLEEGYKPWVSAVSNGMAVLGPSFSDPTDCEVLMMVGLPASGKSTWAEKWVKEHPEKRYVLLGTNLALDQMKVPGLLRKNNYGERFDRLMDRANGIFNTLLSRAAKVPRNYILDQTNVYKNARKRKLKPFANYHKIAVVVFPQPEELKIRAEKRFREMGKEVPPEAVNEMLANFVLPMSKEMHCTDEYFDKIIFPELDRAEAQLHLDEMKRALAMASTGMSNSDHSSYLREGSLHTDSRVTGAYPLSTTNRDYAPHSRESSLHVDHNASSYLLWGPRHACPGYTGPYPEAQGVAPGSCWIASNMQQPYPTNVINTGYTGTPALGRAEPMPPYPNTASTGGRGQGQLGRIERPCPGACDGSLNAMPPTDIDAYHGTYSSYRNDPLLRRHDTLDFMGSPGEARAAYPSPFGSAYGGPTSNPRPYRGIPGNPRPAPYGGPPPPGAPRYF